MRAVRRSGSPARFVVLRSTSTSRTRFLLQPQVLREHERVGPPWTAEPLDAPMGDLAEFLRPDPASQDTALQRLQVHAHAEVRKLTLHEDRRTDA